jgi:hypothetical protein
LFCRLLGSVRLYYHLLGLASKSFWCSDLSSSRDFFLKREDSQAAAYSQSLYSSRSSDERDVQQRDVWRSPESVKLTFYGGVSDNVIANSSNVVLGKALGSDLVGGSHF